MNSGELNKVWEIKALRRKPGEDTAKNMLERIAKQVQPIMREHKWRVKLLSEFCPKNPALLGLNVGRGIEVKLRLRRPNKDSDFYPFDKVLDTMLHELCHNAHAPHNDNFYKLWDQLRKECEEFMAKGISGTGQGFDLPGKHLGGFSHQPPLSSLRKSALAAAENRLRLESLQPSGPKRLGGDSTIMVALSPVQAAAMAAERRLQDDIWCASSAGDAVLLHVDEECCSETTELPHAGQTVVNLASNSSSHGMDAAFRKRRRDSDVGSSFQSCSDHSAPNFVDLFRDVSVSKSTIGFDTKSSKRTCVPVDTPNSQSCTEEGALWECGTCTLLNPPLAPICELCSTLKPKDDETKYKHWSCKFCTLENSVQLEKCSACSRWRYSHGPPVTIQGPNLDT